MRDPFVDKSEKKKPGFNVGVILNSKKLVKGKVGLEIEVEGKNLLHDGEPPSPWIYHKEDSLRGAEHAEYVLTHPIEFNKVGDALEALWKALRERKAVFDDSNRTSVHVHLNCQEFHLNRLATFMALYFTLEKPLTQWCGEHRVGNLFCLRSNDAPAIVSHIRKFIKSDGKYEINDNMHYAGLNANALKKFGSVEIRTMRGVNNPETILDWVEILERLYNFSANFTDPRDLCGMFSQQGPLSFFENVLGPKTVSVRSGISFTDDQIRDAMYEGIRLAQDICYCRDWGLYQPTSLVDDPFGRDLKGIAKKIIQSDWLPDSAGVPEPIISASHSLNGSISDYINQVSQGTNTPN